MNVGIGTEAALFPEKEYIMDISFAVWWWGVLRGLVIRVGRVFEVLVIRMREGLLRGLDM
jgi:hypothetical protein